MHHVCIGRDTMDRNRARRDHKYIQREPEHPFPVEFKQKRKHQGCRGGLQVDSHCERQRGKKRAVFVKQHAQEDQIHHMQIHLYIQ